MLRLARGDHALPGLQHRAHHDVLDLLRRDLRALERGGDRDPAELGGVSEASAPPSLPIGVRALPRITVLGICARSLLDRFRPPRSVVSIAEPRQRPRYARAAMRVQATTAPLVDSDADTLVVGVFEGEDSAHAALQALLESGEAKRRTARSR